MGNSSHEDSLLWSLRRALPAIAGLAATALLAACGASMTGSAAGSSASSSAAATATPAATSSASCEQVTALRAALTKLSNVRVNAKSVRQVSADLASTENAVTALKDEASPAFSAEASQVRAELTMIGKHAQALSSHPTPANLRATTTAINELKTAVRPAITIIQTACAS